MKSSPEKELSNTLGKEFWGILSFELNLPALYELILGDKMGIGLKRFGDWVLFPHKIPLDIQEKFEQLLEKRRVNPLYDKLLSLPMNEKDEGVHLLIVELLRLKYSGGSSDPSYLRHLYQLSDNVFFALSIQFVEKGFISSQKMIEIYQHYYYAKGENDE